ncbi:OmpA family protein [Pendulispora brunnea]|uniref:OmpA family protein n=1 Tax=Pendulispora brunnea TaxID=2905690 RepID=A0ABZ2JZ06_9BACT
MKRLTILPTLGYSVFALLVSGCVSSGKYDTAVKNAENARNELRHVMQTDRVQIDDLKRRYNEADSERTQLRGEVERLGSSADSLAAEKGSLSSQLSDMRRAHSAAEARALLYRALALRFKRMIDAGDLSIVLRDGRMVLRLPNDVLFESGQVDIKPRGQTALKQIAMALKGIAGRQFQVAGHTDNVPIDTARFPSNWELSTARGVEVVRFLVAQGVAPGALSAAGYGEFEPITSNDDAGGRARNRRIEITLQPNVDEMIAIPENK